MTKSLDARIARLEAVEEIRVLKARYADVCDTGYDPDRMAAVLHATTPSGTAASASAATRGSTRSRVLRRRVEPDHVGAALHDRPRDRGGSDDLEHGNRQLVPLAALHRGRRARPQAVWLTGRYADRYRREEDGWKFSEVRLDTQTVSPFEDGWVRKPFWNEP